MDSRQAIAHDLDMQSPGMEKALVTAATEKMTASVKVVIIPELLDNILLRTSPREALLTSRVCKAFYQHVHGSTLVAQRLYLHPKAAKKQTCLITEPRYDVSWDHEGQLQWDTSLFRSVLIKGLGFGPCTGSFYSRDTSDGDMVVTLIDLRHEDTTASWNNMLLTQPPTEKVIIWIGGSRALNSTYGGLPLLHRILRCEEGITLGHVVSNAVMLLQKSGAHFGEEVHFSVRLQ